MYFLDSDMGGTVALRSVNKKNPESYSSTTNFFLI